MSRCIGKCLSTFKSKTKKSKSPIKLSSVHRLNRLPIELREKIYDYNIRDVNNIIRDYLDEMVYINERIVSNDGVVTRITRHDIFNYDYKRIRNLLKLMYLNDDNLIKNKIYDELMSKYLEPIISLYEDIDRGQIHYKLYIKIKELNKLLQNLKKQFNITLKKEFLTKINNSIKRSTGFGPFDIKYKDDSYENSYEYWENELERYFPNQSYRSTYIIDPKKLIKGKTRARFFPQVYHGESKSRENIKTIRTMPTNRKRSTIKSKQKTPSPQPEYKKISSDQLNKNKKRLKLKVGRYQSTGKLKDLPGNLISL